MKHITDNELVQRFTRLVKSERKLTHLILQDLVEIERRRLYLESYPSMFEFLTKGHGYSASAILRRLDSARLLRDIPEVAEKIESGTANLSQLSKIQQAARAAQKSAGKKISVQAKRELVHKIEGLPSAQTDLVLAQELDLPILRENNCQNHRDESVTLTISFTKGEMQELEKIKALLSHSVPDGKWSSLFLHLASNQKSLKNREKQIRQVSAEAHCEHADPKTGAICGSKYFLQIDHKQPRWAGGLTEPRNLQILCSAHNQQKYRKESRIRSG